MKFRVYKYATETRCLAFYSVSHYLNHSWHLKTLGLDSLLTEKKKFTKPGSTYGGRYTLFTAIPSLGSCTYRLGMAPPGVVHCCLVLKLCKSIQWFLQGFYHICYFISTCLDSYAFLYSEIHSPIIEYY